MFPFAQLITDLTVSSISSPLLSSFSLAAMTASYSNTTVRGCDIGPVDPRLLTGSPIAGGFRAMPLEEHAGRDMTHVMARHLAHASALLTYLLQDVVQQEGGAHDSATPPPPAAAVHRPLWVQAAAHQLRIAIRAMQRAGSLEDREGRLDADATRQLLTTTHPDVHRLAVSLSRLGWRDTPSDVFICPAAATISVKEGTHLLT